MYSVDFSRKAESQLNKLNILIQRRILDSLERIRIRPFHFVKRKIGTPHYILRVGSYRVILNIQQNKLIILVLKMGLRRKIYK